jgi:molybdopterin molybdotransferase
MSAPSLIPSSRPPSSPRPDLLKVQDALDRILQSVHAVTESEIVTTLNGLGRVLHHDLHARINVPPMDNSAMDGYAVRVADCRSGAARLPVAQRIPAGHVGVALAPGTAARIFTGAMIPEGADAVVMQEQCTVDGDHVVIGYAPVAGENIRTRGDDIRAGACLLQAGLRLRPQALGLAASVGIAELAVVRRLRVAVFFTGDELTMPGTVAPDQLKPGAIYNSNRFVLRGLLENLGCTVTDFGIVPDSLDATRAILRGAAEGYDFILTSGGVSVGEEDHVKAAVEAEGALHLWQIAMKPGKPLAFGRVGHAVFMGLPGNPVSSFVTFLLFARPAVLKLQGARLFSPQAYAMRADFDLKKADRRQEYLRVRINEEGGLELFSSQSSAVMTSTVWGDGLIENPPGQLIQRGDSVRFLPFSELLS